MTPRIAFSRAGYDFWTDGERWNVAKPGQPAPHCAYKTPEAIAQLKGVNIGSVYTIRANGETYHFATLAEAQAAAETIHQQTGAIAGIEQEPRT